VLSCVLSSHNKRILYCIVSKHHYSLVSSHLFYLVILCGDDWELTFD